METRRRSVIALCLAGMEREVSADITNYFSDERPPVKISITSLREDNLGVIAGESACGKLLVTFENGFPYISFTEEIRSVQHWLLYLSRSDDIRIERELGLHDIQQILRSVEWEDCILGFWKAQNVMLAKRLATAAASFAIAEASFPGNATAGNQNRTIGRGANYSKVVNRYADLFSNESNNSSNGCSAIASAANVGVRLRIPSFCGRCVRGGKHEFNSMDVAQLIGEEVTASTPWTVDLTTMDFEIICFLHQNQLVVGANILTEQSKPFLKSSLPNEIHHPVLPSTISPSLRPSTAYIMAVLLGALTAGDVLVDCMCGSGAAFIEAAYKAFPSPVECTVASTSAPRSTTAAVVAVAASSADVDIEASTTIQGTSCRATDTKASSVSSAVALGGDVDLELHDTLRQTIAKVGEMSSHRSIAEAMFWSAHRLPLLDACTDVAVIDLPFGRVLKRVPRSYRQPIRKFIMEIARVLRPGGRCVILAQTQQQVLTSVDSTYFLHNSVVSRPVNIGGYLCYIVCATRTAAPFLPQQLRSQQNQSERQLRPGPQQKGVRGITDRCGGRSLESDKRRGRYSIGVNNNDNEEARNVLLASTLGCSGTTIHSNGSNGISSSSSSDGKFSPSGSSPLHSMAIGVCPAVDVAIDRGVGKTGECGREHHHQQERLVESDQRGKGEDGSELNKQIRKKQRCHNRFNGDDQPLTKL